MSQKELQYSDGKNEYYIINPTWFKVFIIFGIVLVVLVVILLILIVAGVIWINNLNIVSRLFALVESSL